MTSEVYALILGFGNVFAIRDMLEHMLGREVDIEAFQDSKTLFHLIAKKSRTIEWRLQIDVSARRESYRNGEISCIG